MMVSYTVFNHEYIGELLKLERGTRTIHNISGNSRIETYYIMYLYCPEIRGIRYFNRVDIEKIKFLCNEFQLDENKREEIEEFIKVAIP